MRNINVNGIANYQHLKQREARLLITEMSNEQKQHTLDNIHAHQGVNNFTGQPYDSETLHYIEKLLTGEK